MRKIYQDSIDLLQRTEKLALQYSDKGFYLAFSGGKDSQCLYHMLDMGHVLRVIHQHYRWLEAVKESKKKRHSYYMQCKVSKYG